MDTGKSLPRHRYPKIENISDGFGDSEKKAPAASRLQNNTKCISSIVYKKDILCPFRFQAFIFFILGVRKPTGTQRNGFVTENNDRMTE